MVYLELNKPVTKREFQHLAKAIRNSDKSAENDDRIRFNASGYIVSCVNHTAGIKALAHRLANTVLHNGPVKVKPHRLPTRIEVICNNKDDPKLLSAILNYMEGEH